MIEITAITMEAVPLNFTDQFALVVSINILNGNMGIVVSIFSSPEPKAHG